MCDYCDCRSHPEIAEPSAEHDELTGPLGHLRAAVRANDRAADGAVVST